ncbi:MAG: Gfo/Idh/MocA family oxidoreductase [Caulobacterales bacterium]|nr:Gfo/Idh/MocA family oxidoreductase [Caulobacterales bacterium]
MTPLRWGVLGTGRMADWFCGDFASVTNGALAAVASRAQSSADAFAARHAISRAYGRYGDMLADPGVDIVYIATPHSAHKRDILAALAAGKHVLCEKPLVANLAEAREVLAAAAASGRYLAEAMWTWSLPAMRAAKAWADAGRIGRIVHVKTDFGYPVPYDPGRREYADGTAGGALREMGVYPIAISRLFLDRDPNGVHVVHQAAPNGVEWDVSALFDFGDATAALATSYRCRMGNAAHILGEDGYVIIPDAYRCHRAQLFHLDTLIEAFDAPRQERGYHLQAIAAGEDIAAGRAESAVVPLAASLAFQRDMAAILSAIGRPSA